MHADIWDDRKTTTIYVNYNEGENWEDYPNISTFSAICVNTSVARISHSVDVPHSLANRCCYGHYTVKDVKAKQGTDDNLRPTASENNFIKPAYIEPKKELHQKLVMWSHYAKICLKTFFDGVLPTNYLLTVKRQIFRTNDWWKSALAYACRTCV